MVTLDQLKDFMRKKAEEDRAMKSIQVTGETLEEALKNAQIELGLPLKKIEYDILQKGNKGLFGYGKKAWSLLAYEITAQVAEIKDDELEMVSKVDQELEELEKDVDSEVFVRLYHDGAYMKVTKALGNGKPMSEDLAINALHSRAVRDIDTNAIRAAVKLAQGTYTKVGDFIHNPAADTLMNCEHEDNEMKGILVVNPPGPGGADLSFEEVVQFLKSNGIVFGVDEKIVQDFIDKPRYNEKVEVAFGAEPQHGADAKIQYFFDTSLKFKPKEIDGRVDFKSLNTIHNVLKGEDLAKKEPLGKGIPGRTVTGKMIPARDGKDIQFDMGNNVELSRDGLRVISTADGQVLLQKGKISVETVMVIPGDVGVATGDINSFGSVIVKGNVEDGYTVKSAGNVEIMGNVGKSTIETPGDIIVHQGINGNGGGSVHAGQNLWSKFVQNANVQCGAYVIVSDGIIHSHITANKKVLCKGKRAKIVGGHIVAAEEINAVTLGAVNAGETLLEVGFDPKAKEELKNLTDTKETLEKNYDELEVNYQGLEKTKRIRKKLPDDKERQLVELQKALLLNKEEIKKVDRQIEKKQEYLDSLRHMGRVSAAKSVYPGVKVIYPGLRV
jgi:uncharacterized protein (DUF342 family)